MARRKKKNIFLKVFRLIGLFIGGLAVAVFVALSQVNLETLRGNILSVLRSSTGLPVEIDGAVSWKFSLRPKIELHDVRVKNADWAKNDYGFDADKIDVTLNLVSLLRNHPTIQNVSINDAKIALEKNSNGAYSLMVNEDEESDDDKNSDKEKTKSQPKYPVKSLGVGGIEIRNLTANIDGEKYAISNFSMRYMSRNNKREFSGWVKSGLDVFPFVVSFSEYNSERKIYPMSVAFTTGGTPLIANVALEGTSLMPIDFIVRGDVPNIAAFGSAIGQKWSELPPMAINIAGGLGKNKLTLRKSSVAVRGVNINFSGEYDWSKSIPKIIANIDAGSVDLEEMFPRTHTWVHPKRDLNAFKDTSLYGKELNHINLQAHLKIKSLIVYRDLSLDDMDVDFKTNAGHGRIDMDFIFADGKFKVASNFDIDADGRVYANSAVRAENMYIGTLLYQVREDDVISDLPVNLSIYAVANGRDLSEFMKTITGPVLIKSTGSGYAHSELVSYIYGKDTLTSLRQSIQDMFSDDKEHDKIKIKCATVNVKLRNGLAETQNGVAVETNAINARLAGNLDLGKEKMKLSLTTVPVRGLKLSLSGNVVNSVEITGNLSEPDVKVSGLSVAGKVASATGIGLLLAPFTGGLSVVAGAGIGLVAGDLLENWLADDDPCKTAAKHGAPVRRDDPKWFNTPISDLMNSVFDNTSQLDDNTDEK